MLLLGRIYVAYAPPTVFGYNAIIAGVLQSVNSRLLKEKNRQRIDRRIFLRKISKSLLKPYQSK